MAAGGAAPGLLRGCRGMPSAGAPRDGLHPARQACCQPVCKNPSLVSESGASPVRVSPYGLSFGGPRPDLQVRCPVCRFHSSEPCHGSLLGSLAGGFPGQRPGCGASEYAQHGSSAIQWACLMGLDQDAEKSPPTSPTFRFYSRARSTDCSGPSSNRETGPGASDDRSSRPCPSAGNSAENTQDAVYLPKSVSSDPYLSKIICHDTPSDDSPQNWPCFDSPALSHSDLAKCDIRHIVNGEQLSGQLLQKQCFDDLDADPIDLEDDEGSCIDVEDTGCELEEAPEKTYVPLSKRREYPKRKHFKTSAYRRSLRFKEIAGNVTVSCVLRSFRNRRRFLKKHRYIRRISSSEKHTKSVKESSDPLALKKKPSNFANSSEELEWHDKSKGISRKRKRCQDADEYSLNDVTYVQEFSHLFRSAPRLPVEIRDGQRLGRKYRKRYNICDLTYVHVHRQISAPKVQFDDINEDKDDDESSFDILNLIPREMVPVVTSNSQLGFKEAIIDKRLMRYKRGVPIFRVGRRVPGELS